MACRAVVVTIAALYICLLAVPGHAAQGAKAVPALVLGAGVDSFRIESYVEVLEDPTRSLSVDSVRGSNEGQFRTRNGAPLNFGYSSAAYWVRLRIEAGSVSQPDWLLVLENPLIAQVVLYRFGPEDRVTVVENGRGTPTRQRPVRSRSLVLPLGSVPPGTSELLIRLVSEDVSTFPMRIVRRDHFAAEEREVQLLVGLYIGVSSLMALLNVLLFTYTSRASYLSYTLFICANALLHAAMTGFGYEYLWPDAPAWDRASVPVFVSLSVVFGLVFARQILRVRELSPLLYSLSNVIVGAAFLALPLAAVGNVMAGGAAGSVLGLSSAVMLTCMLLLALRRKVKLAAYLLLSGVPLFVAIGVTTLRNFGFVSDDFVTTHAVEIGSLLQVTLLSLALVAGVRSDQKEKERAKAAALESQRIAGESLRRSLECRLQALQAKINPHFLFNALNAVVGLVRDDPDRAERVIIKLSRLFRYTLDATEQEWVSLARELHIVRTYLEIEQCRFGDRLSFDVRTIGDVEQVRIPGLTIQPLVENSVKHGLSPKVEGGTILVSANVTSDGCTLVVEDDGIGLQHGDELLGHGLANVRERLGLAYGGRSSMSISSNEGVRIEINVPLRCET